MHLQIDTFEDPRDAQLYHRGYCQIKVFCDKVIIRSPSLAFRESATSVSLQKNNDSASAQTLTEVDSGSCKRSLSVLALGNDNANELWHAIH